MNKESLLHFKTSAKVEHWQLPLGVFDNDCSLFEVFINGTKTDYTVADMNFDAGDEVLIRTRSGAPFPEFKLQGAPISEILAPLPKIQTIYAEDMKDFTDFFSECTDLVKIPADLFINNPQAQNFSGCFSLCTSLTTIPAKLFANNPKATLFRCCFEECRALTSIPAELFANNQEVTHFAFCFMGCHGLTSIPAKLFANNPKATMFRCCFADCQNIMFVPDDLFPIHIRREIASQNCFKLCKNIVRVIS